MDLFGPADFLTHHGFRRHGARGRVRGLERAFTVAPLPTL
jgi:hypothetical protein